MLGEIPNLYPESVLLSTFVTLTANQPPKMRLSYDISAYYAQAVPLVVVSDDKILAAGKLDFHFFNLTLQFSSLCSC